MLLFINLHVDHNDVYMPILFILKRNIICMFYFMMLQVLFYKYLFTNNLFIDFIFNIALF